MIALSKLDGSTMYLNEDHVERVEQGANSAVYLTNGTYLIVRDDVDDHQRQDQVREGGAPLRRFGAGRPGSVAGLSAVPDETPRMQSRP